MSNSSLLRGFPVSLLALAGLLIDVRPATAQANLVAAYGFNEGTDTTAVDASGNGNTGSIGTATWTTAGKYGNALTFNGTSARVTVPDAASLRLTTAMTLEAWVYPSTVNGRWRDVIYKGNDNYYLEGTSNGGNPAVGGTFGGVNANLYGTARLAVNTWTHLAATYDGATLRMYVNGVQVASAARSGNLATSTNPLSIGGDSIYGQYFAGRIDEVRVYNVALTAAQIQSDMNTPVAGGGGTLTPDLTVTKTHGGTFSQGQVGATYTLTVNNAGTGATAGTVTVTDTLPSGLTATAVSGTGWACTLATLSCTRSTALAAGTSYPAVTLTVNVSSTAPASVTNTAAVSGGGEVNTTNNTANDVTAIGAVPDLTVTKTHGGTFSQGQVGATYTLTVNNAGTGATAGTVTVTDTLPSGLTATAVSGTGWACTLATLSCTRSTALAAGTSYPAVTLTVNVSSTAPASVTNTAAVSGGGEVNTTNNTANDVTAIGAVPDLTVTKTHGGTFSQGQVGATYTLTVNNAGTGATAGTVTVTDTLPSGLTATAVSGTGWACTLATLSCTRSTALAAGTSYPAVTLTVNVSSTAPASVTNTAAVSGGGEVNTTNNTANDLTTIATPTAGLVAAYGFNEGTGTTAVDASGTGNTGSIGTATWTTSGKYGSALTFNGTNARVTVPDAASLRLTTAMTLEAWVYPTTVTAAWRDVIYKGNDNYYLEGTSDASGGSPAVGGTFGGSNANVYGTAGLPVNTWTHLAATYDGATLRLYVNGAQVASAARSGALATSTNPLSIGGDNLYPQYFAGRIDEVRIYNVSLTAAQIQSDMNTPLAGGGSLLPDLTVTKTHSGAFTQGQVGATYTLTVNNAGTGATAGTVTVTDTLPSGLTGTVLSGPGWTCTLATLSCTRSDALGAGGSYPAVTLTVDVSSTAPASVTNTAAVSGGGEVNTGNNSASDVTTILGTPDSEPPSAPGLLTAIATSGTTVDLSWGAATDNVGVTSYRVERCEGVGCTDFVKLSTANPTGTTLTDTGLVPNTSYSYVVRAVDAAGNIGPVLNVATITTLSTIPELVAAYAFNEGNGSTVADLSGKGNNGTILNASWTTSGKYGSALFFNGTNARVTVANATSLQLSTGMTLEAWVNPSTVTSNWRDVIYKGNDRYYLEATSSVNGAPAAGGTFAASPVFATTALQVGVWTHLAATYDGLNLRLYVNGVQVSNLSVAGSIAGSTNPLEIGGDSIFGQYFHGSIDDVRVYNVARTPTQIQADMSTPVGGAVPVVDLSQTSVNFGTLASGTTSEPVPIVLTNAGSAALSISSIGIVGTNSGDFAQTNNCGASLNPSVACTISATFSPTAVGSRTATLRIQDDASGSPHTVTLSGTSVAVLVTPSVAAPAPNGSQQFTATSGSVGTFVWSVDGVVGGSSTVGTITSNGFYTAPATIGGHTVGASTPDLSQSGAAAVYVVNSSGVFTFHNDNFRTGLNSSEAILRLSNVNSGTFGKRGSYTIDGQAIASPLYVPAVSIPGQGVHDVVYIATEHNSVYAFDADVATSSPLWQVSFINPAAGVTTVPATETGECCDIQPEVGITGTPVIDPATGTLYVVAKTKEVVGGSTRYVQRLHALNITTGAEKFGGPVEIQASVSGTGTGSLKGQLSFNPLRHNQRPALMLDCGVVYIAWGSHGDIQPYHGWVMGYNATTLQRVMVFCTTPDGSGGGVWLSGDGLAADQAGNIYFVTANGTFDANLKGRNYGDTYVKLSPSGVVLDYFTPSYQASLDTGNHDLGSANVTLLPDQPGAHPRLALMAGKNGTIHMVDRDGMGGYNPSGDTQIVQTLLNIFPFGTPEPGNYSAAVYFNGNVYFSPVADYVQAFSLTNGLLSSTATSRSPEIYAYPGGTISASSAGTTDGILWAIQWNGTSQRSVLRAYDASNLSIELYNSDQVIADRLDPGAKFTAPVIANGKVFVASSGRLTVFGLRP